jgi:hypothetical protein
MQHDFMYLVLLVIVQHQTFQDINFMPVTNLMHKFLYSYNVTVLYTFQAVLCSSSGGQIVCIQRTLSSLSVSGRGGRTVHRFLNMCTVRPPRPLIESDDTICCIHTI